MFTGLIETTGQLLSIRPRSNYKLLSIQAQFDSGEIVPGESIACDGVCLTVVSFSQGEFVVEASQETTACSIVRNYKTGHRINLERALKVGDRLGGHFVSGHVDCIGKISMAKTLGDSFRLEVNHGSRFDPLVIEKGSIAINGLSLTVNKCRSGWLSVNIIPHTIKETTIGDLTKGEDVNLEFDMIGKYVTRLSGDKQNSGLTLDKLKESGW